MPATCRGCLRERVQVRSAPRRGCGEGRQGYFGRRLRFKVVRPVRLLGEPGFHRFQPAALELLCDVPLVPAPPCSYTYSPYGPYSSYSPPRESPAAGA
jgi:hypothetical protein